MTTAERIRQARETRGISQAKLASLINVSPATVYRWETGRSEPPIGSAGQMARALGVPLDDLYVHVPDGATADAVSSVATSVSPANDDAPLAVVPGAVNSGSQGGAPTEE
ncbi:helix-turn-helix transcriptional regulator [Miltoncostaea oceani]|uniref:helix-turn-helix transcriptional regulator n=1 Tax=Miltoncostaea oceani TaxID=2843216 RepID=UPI001C3C4E47|nr:helix-turn-helix transcriptional regulator [Miltoncostaea oceani]